jgi:hypothetical protein
MFPTRAFRTSVRVKFNKIRFNFIAAAFDKWANDPLKFMANKFPGRGCLEGGGGR